MPKLEITDTLIRDYDRIYDEHEQDDPEYRDILNKFKEDLSHRVTPTEATFKDMIDWLLPPLFRSHVKRGLKLYGYNKYEAVMNKAFEAPEDQKLLILVELYGIKVVTASTLLHFRYPSEFPIMNKEVVETLYDSGDLKDDNISIENYASFCKVIRDISQKFGYGFRDIDKALFEYAVEIKSSKPN